MAVQKLSAITSSASNADANTKLVGVETTGPTDLLFSLAQLGGGMSANPSATASDVAVNGSAATFMRSDGAPAIQKTSATVFGLCKVDGSTITATAGVITAVGGSATAIQVGVTTVLSGTSPRVLYDNAGVLGEAANFTISSGNPNVSATHSYLYDSLNILYGAQSTGDWFVAHAGPGPGSLGSSGGNNCGVGDFALLGLTSGQRNVALGSNALNNLSTESNNTAIGFGALTNISGGGNNTAVGSSALHALTSGTNNVAIGSGTMSNGVVTGSNNLAVGQAAGQSLTSGAGNVAIGQNSISTLTAGSNNIALGASTLHLLAGTAEGNVAIGFQAMQTDASGQENVAIGLNALGSQNGPNFNIGIGSSAGASITSGTKNVAVGYQAGNSITTGSDNVILGGHAGGAAIANTIILSDGAGNLEADWNFTTASQWTISGTLNFKAAAVAATVTANFTADHRLQVTFNGVTYYLPCSTTAW